MSDIQADDDDGANILHAVISNNLETMRGYLQYGRVTPNFAYERKNLVCEAAYSGHVQMLELLLQYNFDPTRCDMSDHMHRQPIHIAASKVTPQIFI